jgi:cytidine deaminase
MRSKIHKIRLAGKSRRDLLTRASAVAQNAHCPYSRFRVGVAVLGAKGVYVGTNVENASYGLTLCAERSALGAAVAAGETKIRAIAVACIDATPAAGLRERMPCGACRQWLLELAPEAEIIVLGVGHSFWLDDLLPIPFAIPARSAGRKKPRKRVPDFNEARSSARQ